MNRIEKLIQELCPNGVPFEKINALVEKVDTVDWQTTESARYIDLATVDPRTSSLGDTDVITEKTAPSRARQAVAVGDVLFGSTRPLQGRRFFVDEVAALPFIASTGYTVLRVNSPKLDPRFLFHWLGTSSFVQHVEACQQGTSYPAISDKNVKRALIPVPPIEVQREIVKILDLFTELEAELEDRRKQYEYYRDQLLTFPEEGGRPGLSLVKLLQLTEVMACREQCSRKRGSGPYTTGKFIHIMGRLRVKRISFVTAGDAKKLTVVEPGELIITNTSENLEDVCSTVAWLGKEPIVIGGHSSVIRSSMDPRFLAYWFRSTNFFPQKHKLATGAKVVDISANKLKKVVLPVPPIEVQREIADVLDKFDAFVNDLSSGLPAEIEARRKQYEYYRDKLLTFKELQPEAA